ncbi:MAG: hypothetical protein RLZ95_663 [Bacteroidota bacterium]|jgi:hypothetical protein
MKPIERIAMYLQFRAITPHSFERKIHLSNGYFSKQIKNLGSVGSDILVKIHDSYPELNMLWVLTGEGDMIIEDIESHQVLKVNEFSNRYESENRKLKNLESDVEKLNVVLKDKDKIIGLYEFMLNGNNKLGTIADTY